MYINQAAPILHDETALDLSIKMVRKGNLRPGRLVDLIDEHNAIIQEVNLGTDAEKLRIQRARKLFEKLLNLCNVIRNDIRDKKIEIAQQRYRAKPCSVAGEPSECWRRDQIENLEQMMEERYYHHHGRGTEKHLLVREQEEQIRIMRRKVVHRENSIAAEKKLIKDLKNAEETRAKIIANGVEYKCSWRKFNSVEDIKNQIKVCRAQLNEVNERVYAKTLIGKNIVWSDKSLRIMEKELKKTNEMYVEILALIHSFYKKL